MSFITSIATATPDHRIAQERIAEFMARAMEFRNGESKKLKAIFRSSGIQYRHSVLADYGRVEGFDFFPNDLTAPFPSTAQRLEVFRKHALPLSVKAAAEALQKSGVAREDITHLVVVCCTGMYAPGLDIELIGALGLRNTVHRTAVNFMGCYAAFNALKLAQAFCKADSQSKVLIVTTELCSLHFQRQATDDNMLANALFADGSAALIVEGVSGRNSALQLEMSGFFSDIAPASDDMAWSIGDLGFEMKLSSYVPDIIQQGIRQLTERLLDQLNKKFSDIRHFAIHPGGKRILDVIEKELSITKEDNWAAYEVLKNFGNMSSPTVLFVLQRLTEKLTQSHAGENILSFAFGPGLTMESMVLQIKRA